MSPGRADMLSAVIAGVVILVVAAWVFWSLVWKPGIAQ